METLKECPHPLWQTCKGCTPMGTPSQDYIHGIFMTVNRSQHWRWDSWKYLHQIQYTFHCTVNLHFV